MVESTSEAMGLEDLRLLEPRVPTARQQGHSDG